VGLGEGGKKEETKEEGRCQWKHNCVHCGAATRSEGERKENWKEEGYEKSYWSWQGRSSNSIASLMS
jgi:hypothetical protein